MFAFDHTFQRVHRGLRIYAWTRGLVLVALAGCMQITLPNGRFACRQVSDCPPGLDYCVEVAPDDSRCCASADRAVCAAPVGEDRASDAGSGVRTPFHDGHITEEVEAGVLPIDHRDAGRLAMPDADGTDAPPDVTTPDCNLPLDGPLERKLALVVGVGDRHACIVSEGGDVWCWGDNDLGQRGVDDSPPGDLSMVTPLVDGVPTVDNESRPAEHLHRKLAVGRDHSCAIYRSGARTGVRCWGANGRGQLGTKTVKGHSTTALDVTGLSAEQLDAAGKRALSVYAGDAFTCAILGTTAPSAASQTEAWCWGDNTFGQLGDGSVTSETMSSTPVRVQGLVTSMGGEQVPCELDHIAAGSDFACAGCSAQERPWEEVRQWEVRCWGNNDRGQLGLGTKETPVRTASVSVALEAFYVQVSAGRAHACARHFNNYIRCWGSNESKQLGYLKVGSETLLGPGLPLQPDDDPNPSDAGFPGAEDIALGDAHSCVHLHNRKTIECWGAGRGCPPPTDEILGPMSARGDRTCAVNKSGQVFCWGR